jgi:F-type H+-transporting ATPase subunit epsilon
METSNTFKLTIKTPSESVFEGEVKSLMVDTESGKMMVLPHHTSLVGAVAFSNVLISSGDKLQEYSVRNGFLSIDNASNSTDLLCIHCEKTQTVKYTSVASYLKYLEEELKSDSLNSYQLQFLEDEKFAVVKQLETLDKDKGN